MLKKVGMDPALHKNYGLPSKLPFLSNILEKVVADQVTAAVESHNLRFNQGLGNSTPLKLLF